MAFVDQVSIKAHAGKGGDGVIRWLRNKETARGGPSGGDGGRGGDVVLKGVRDFAALAHYRYEKSFRAQDGSAGENRNKTGADGASVVLRVPIGTLVRVLDTGEEVEVLDEEEIVLFKGGLGGRGNSRFKGPTNQNPFEVTLGKPGKGGNIELTLKLIADAGLIGLPNAGKSSLLNAITRAQSKVGAYAFTTLEPNLGDFYGHILADIPGLIEGASKGKGLGTKFLKHIERTGILLHLVAADQEDVVKAYKEVRTELEAFGQGLEKKKEFIVLSKIDLVSSAERTAKKKALEKASKKEVIEVSVEDKKTLKAFTDTLTKLFSK